ncbi:MAG TPA: phosphatidate cytidylyltransferase [Candidatus Faecousia faecigallinarum]|nr:phosphatidate cytidylyltransferase [Candidatus Faecousia faecigallinarum]
MKTRVLSAVALLPILLVIVLVLPAWATATLFAAAGAVAAYELLYRTGLVKNRRLVIYAMVMAVLVAFWSLRQDVNLAAIGLLAYLCLLLGEMLLAHAKLRFEKICLCMAAGVLLPYLLCALVRIRAMYAGMDPAQNTLGKYYILIAFIIAFSADSGAYFVGRALGKHKLAPVISPNKTVEGALGGVASAVVLMLLYGLILDKSFGFDVIYWYGIIYGVLGALISMLGDLSFSVIKRQVNIKDYGNLIPGHGGVLDRFDSMMLVAPLVELLLRMLTFAVPMAGVG